MKIITGPLGSGKTTELIKMAAEGFYYIVCFSRDEAGRIKKQAREMELDIPLPITYDEFIRGEFARGRNIKGFLIDNVDNLLNRMACGVDVKGVSFLHADMRPIISSPRGKYEFLNGSFEV